MCLAIPGKVAEVKKDKVIVDYEVDKREAKVLGFNLKPGDWVLVQQGFVINKLDEKTAKESLDAWKSLQ